LIIENYVRHYWKRGLLALILLAFGFLLGRFL
jgi:hypothetical protein